MKAITAALVVLLTSSLAHADVEGECTYSEMHSSTVVACGKKLDASGWRCWKRPSSAMSTTVDSNFTTYPFSHVAPFEDSGPTKGFFCGIKSSDGSILCWRNDGEGVVATGTEDRVTEAPAGTGYKGISATGRYVCAIKSDDTIECWGRRTYTLHECFHGVNEDLTCATNADCPASTCITSATSLTVDFAQPYDDPPSGGYDQISCDDQGANCCGITTGGAIDCFGDLGYLNDNFLFTAIPSGTNWDRVVVSNDGACAHRSTDNHIECWGEVGVSGVNDWPDPPAGAYHIDFGTAQYGGCARKISDSKPVCWQSGGTWLTDDINDPAYLGTRAQSQLYMYKSGACFFNSTDSGTGTGRVGQIRCEGRSYGAMTPQPGCDYIWPSSTTTTTTLPVATDASVAVILFQ